MWLDANGQPIRAIDHVVHRSNDVDSVPGFTLHEHNHSVALFDFVRGTVTLNGAINVLQRPGAGSVILNAGHKVFDLETGTPRVLARAGQRRRRGLLPRSGVVATLATRVVYLEKAMLAWIVRGPAREGG